MVDCINSIHVLYKDAESFPFALGISAAIFIDKIDYLANKTKPYLLLVLAIIVLTALIICRQNPLIPKFSGIRVDGFIAFFIAFTLII